MNNAVNNLAILHVVIQTLGNITVSGKENMSRLLGCIAALEEYVAKEKNNG